MRVAALMLAALALVACEPAHQPAPSGHDIVVADIPAAQTDAPTADADTPIAADVSPATATVKVK